MFKYSIQEVKNSIINSNDREKQYRLMLDIISSPSWDRSRIPELKNYVAGRVLENNVTFFQREWNGWSTRKVPERYHYYW